MINYWDLAVLDGWDWELVEKSTTLTPYETYRHDDLKFHDMATFPLFISARFSGSSDAKYTELHVMIDEKDLSASPYIINQEIGSISGRNPFFQLNTYDETNNIYVLLYAPTVIIPAKKRLEIFIHHPNIVDGTTVTNNSSIYIKALVIKITDIDKFINSLKKLR